MAHIPLPEDAPGIIGLLTKYPDSGRHLSGLAQAVLRGPSSLTDAEREMIATYVSAKNECQFCTNSHGAAARQLLSVDGGLVDEMLSNVATARISEKLRSLLTIADKVRRGGRLVNSDDIAMAQTAGADEKAIHDTVLIAAMFCMYNRYVDGLGTHAPTGQGPYEEMGVRLATRGYLNS